MPDWIHTLVTSDAFGVLARIVLTSFFWIAGIFSLINPAPIVATVVRAGLPAPRWIVAAMIATELGGSALLISNVGSLGWLGAGWLGVFTALSIPLGHPFWKFPPPKRMEEMQIALEHVTVIGGLMCATALLALTHQPAGTVVGYASSEELDRPRASPSCASLHFETDLQDQPASACPQTSSVSHEGKWR